MSVVKISTEDLARIFDPSLRDPTLEAARLATLARVRTQQKDRQEKPAAASVSQASD